MPLKTEGDGQVVRKGQAQTGSLPRPPETAVGRAGGDTLPSVQVRAAQVPGEEGHPTFLPDLF